MVAVTEKKHESLVFVVEVRDRSQYGMVAHFRYRLDLTRNDGSIDAVGDLDFLDSRTPGPLDDDTSAEYHRSAEQMSLAPALTYLRNLFPGATLSGTVNGTHVSTMVPNPRIYNLADLARVAAREASIVPTSGMADWSPVMGVEATRAMQSCYGPTR